MLARDVPAPDHELLACSDGGWWGRCRAAADHVDGAIAGQLRSASMIVSGAAHAHRAGVVAVVVGKRIDEPGHRLIEGEVRHHGGDHRAQADLVIGARHRLHALDGGSGEFEEQVVAGGEPFSTCSTAVISAESTCPRAPVAADPRRRVEQELEAPEIADAFGQAAMAVGMGIDQAGNDEPPPGVDHLRVGVGHRAGRDDVGNDVAFDDDVAGLAARGGQGMHQSA